ncbi:MAG TPA: PA14 domain-containing protein, partial [Candidatus Binatia bacterium]|nr:PA14 domain-containing protein [Candidatus Binatia bacterium]
MIQAVLRVFILSCAFLFDFGFNGQLRAEIPAVNSLTNGLLQECWTNLAGIPVRALTGSPNYPLKPDSVSRCADFETSGPGENYGERLRGWLLPPVTGNYIFWIASDDTSELWLSSDDNPAHRHRIARVSFYTGARDWNRYLEQRSDLIPLEAGKRYYIEALHKQGPGVAHVSVAWQIPGKSRELIAGQWLRPWNEGRSGEGVTLGTWTDADSHTLPEPSNETPVQVEQLSECAAPAAKSGANNRQCLLGYVHPPSSGAYRFSVQGGKLFLSTNAMPANERAIGSEPVLLEAGRSYCFAAVQNDSATPVSVGWQLPDGTRQNPISGGHLTPYDSDYDGMPDWWELRHGLNPYDPDDALADSDGDGLS